MGPNKLTFFGIFQPFIDALKLIIKEITKQELTKSWKLYFFPGGLFFCIIFLWFLIPSKYSNSRLFNDFFFLLLILGVEFFFVLLLAIFSNSKYAFIGRIRSARQRIRYEICLRFIIFCPLVLFFSLSFKTFFLRRIRLSLIIFFFWWVLCLIQCNRAPFDFSEGERELIRGFNIEYGSVGFIYIFLREYGRILFFSIFRSLLFFNLLFVFFLLFFSFILIRSSFPRYRYDLIIKICWIIILPFTIFIFFSFLFF